MFEKKSRIKIPKEAKVKAELQQEIGSLCPFCDNTEVGHFEIHHIDENPGNNILSNLLLLCPICHSKITKGDIKEAEVLRKKIELIKNPVPSKPKGYGAINFNAQVNNAIVGDNNKISINQSKKVMQKYPEGCIGYEHVKANYISHLIARYNEYKESEVGKGKMSYAIFPSQLKARYKIGPSRAIYHLPVSKFDELVSYIQLRIDSTRLAKFKGAKHKNYSSFEEYAREHG